MKPKHFDGLNQWLADSRHRWALGLACVAAALMMMAGLMPVLGCVGSCTPNRRCENDTSSARTACPANSPGTIVLVDGLEETSIETASLPGPGFGWNSLLTYSTADVSNNEIQGKNWQADMLTLELIWQGGVDNIFLNNMAGHQEVFTGDETPGGEYTPPNDYKASLFWNDSVSGTATQGFWLAKVIVVAGRV